MMRSIFFYLALLAAPMATGQVVINEICAANGDIKYDPQFFQFPAWVEIHNPGNVSIDLSGYWLSDSVSMPRRWAIPAGTTIQPHDYLLIWCDGTGTGLHTNFSLDPDGESVILSNPAGNITDQISFGPQLVNTSFGRISDGNAQWRQASKPTPALANIPGPMNGPTSAPVFSQSSGRYPGAISVTITAAPGAEIRFTTNGSAPGMASEKYTGSLTISSTTVLKARAFHSDYLPSGFTAATYFINEHVFTLPVVSISTDPRYLFNDTIGIYVEGINGIIENCTTVPANWNMNWDRHAVFEYLSTSGTQRFQQDLDIRLAGNCTRRYSQKSFAIEASKKYGLGKLNYPFFDQKKDIVKYENFFLRNSGNDNGAALLRDALLQYLPQGYMDIDYLAYEPVTVYLNGQYWGIQDLREKIDADYIEENYGIDASDVDIIQKNIYVDEGTGDAWFSYLDSLALLNPNDPATYSFVQKHIDVQEYINWLVINTYSANTDWPSNDRAWHQRSNNGKWRWILWDLDFGFGRFPDQSDYNHPTLDFINDPINNARFTQTIRLHMAVPEFKKLFINSLSAALTTVYEPSRVNQVIDQFKSRIEAEIPFHKTRWGGTKDQWDLEVQRLREFAVKRNEFMKSYIASYYGLGQPIQIDTETIPAGQGQIEFNGTKTQGLNASVYYSGQPYQISALPGAGYSFRDWTVTTRETTRTNLIATGAIWKYFDGIPLTDSSWKNSGFNDGAWKSGPSQLGYGDGDEATVIGFGGSTSNKYVSSYYRKTFSITDTSKVFSLSGSVLFDDGVVVYVNGFEVFRGNMPVGTITGTTLALGGVANELWYNPFIVARKFLVNGVNTIAAEVHQSGVTSSDVSFDLNATLNEFRDVSAQTVTAASISGTASTSLAFKANFILPKKITGIVINEIGASASRVKDDFNEQEDWIELYNNSGVGLDLTGLFISDDPLQLTKYQLPAMPALKIQTGGYLVLWADGQPEQGGSHLPFQLSKLGESVLISQIFGGDTLIIASMVYGGQVDGYSYARIPDRTGPFVTSSRPTPGIANLSTQLIQGLIINEFSAAGSEISDGNGEREDWIELFNASNVPISLDPLFITDSLGQRSKHALFRDSIPMVLQPGSYKLLWADDDLSQGADHISFKLSGSGEDIGIYQLLGTDTIPVATFSYAAQIDGFVQSRIPNGNGPFVNNSRSTPGEGNQLPSQIQGLVINEFSAMASTAADENGDHDDWIELYNTGSQPINLNKLFVTDSIGDPLKHYLYNDSVDLILSPGSFQILWADNEPAEGVDHLGFKLSASGESIGIFQLVGNDTLLVSASEFTEQHRGFSSARIPDGLGTFRNTSSITPGSSNAQPSRISGLVINEYAATSGRAMDQQAEHDDWIEVYNAGETIIDLGSLFITDSLSHKLKHSLYNDSIQLTLQPGAYQIFWADDQLDQGANHIGFKLSSSGESIGFFQFVGEDTVAVAVEVYGKQLSGFSAGRFPNGTGNFEAMYGGSPGLANQRADLISGLTINELSSSKSEFATDEFNEQEDWIELYNTGKMSVNLAGLFISDDSQDKLKSMIHDEFNDWILEPSEYQVLWADEQPLQGRTHLSFKLSSQGERIHLYQLIGGDTIEITSVIFPSIPEDYSYARVPNGRGPFKLNSNITPGEENMEVTGLEHSGNRSFGLSAYPNPASLVMQIDVPLAGSHLEVFDAFGRQIDQFHFEREGISAVNIQHLTNGVYLFRLISDNQVRVGKVIIDHNR